MMHCTVKTVNHHVEYISQSVEPNDFFFRNLRHKIVENSKYIIHKKGR